MRAKNLLIFGDSWPRGSELRANELPFGELLGRLLAVPVLNFSTASTSISHLLLQLRTALAQESDHRDSDAIFFLTSPNRDVMWDANGEKELHINPHHPSDEAIRWYSQFHTPQLASFRVNTSLLALQKICEIHGIRDHYIWGWQTIDPWPEVDRTRFWRNGDATVLDLFAENDTVQFNGTINDYASNDKNLFIYPNMGHPNQRGHEFIARELQTWLQSCT